jgi:macrodomain Ter protein organizer (MatP/YcbG family)
MKKGGSSMLRGNRIKEYPIIVKGYNQVLSDIVKIKEKLPVELSAKNSPEHRTRDEQELIDLCESILSFMRKKRKKNDWDETAPDSELWTRSIDHAFELAKKLDVDYKVWDKLSDKERTFFEDVVQVIGYAEKKAGAHYDDDFGFTARQLRCILRCMKTGEPTPLGAR